MNNDKPTISIGLPVYNGERYLEKAIKSILEQTWSDFELIICDNASTDRTEAISTEYAQKDKRVKYHRNPENLGAARNFNLAVELAVGKYFKWMAHDDFIDPSYLEECMKIYEADPEVVLVYPKTLDVDENDNVLGQKDFKLHERDPRPDVRFRYQICIEHSCYAVFGLMKTEQLKSTPMIGSYVASDRVLLALFSLMGRMYEIPKDLYYHREHQQRSTRSVDALQMMLGWFDPKQKGKRAFPYFRILREYIRSVNSVKLGMITSLKCYFQFLRWFRWHYKDLLGDIGFYLKK